MNFCIQLMRQEKDSTTDLNGIRKQLQKLRLFFSLESVFDVPEVQMCDTLKTEDLTEDNNNGKNR